LIEGERSNQLIEHVRFVLVGTIRRDGTPRISPVEARLVHGHLMLVMIPGTLKARDLLRDPRILMSSPIAHPDDPNREFKLRGHVVEIRDPELREAAGTSLPSTSGWIPQREPQTRFSAVFSSILSYLATHFAHKMLTVRDGTQVIEAQIMSADEQESVDLLHAVPCFVVQMTPG
jgi:hypothetical protein